MFPYSFGNSRESGSTQSEGWANWKLVTSTDAGCPFDGGAIQGRGPRHMRFCRPDRSSIVCHVGLLCETVLSRDESGIVQETTHGLHVERPCKKESLAGVDVLGRQLHTLAVVLDAFGDGFEPERLA